MQYTPYRIQTQSGKHLALRLCDMPGQGVTTCDMNYLLDGLVPENYKVAHILGFDLFRVTNDRIAILSFYVKQLRMLVDLHDFHSFALNEISAF